MDQQHDEQPKPVVELTAADRALMRVRRELSMMPMDVRVADVCPCCGLHTILDEQARLHFFMTGGTTECLMCGQTKTYEVPK